MSGSTSLGRLGSIRMRSLSGRTALYDLERGATRTHGFTCHYLLGLHTQTLY